jgi:hypothetical protein
MAAIIPFPSSDMPPFEKSLVESVDHLLDSDSDTESAAPEPVRKVQAKSVTDNSRCPRAIAAILAKLAKENPDASESGLFDLMAEKLSGFEDAFSKKIPAAVRTEAESALKGVHRTISSKTTCSGTCAAIVKTSGLPCHHKAKPDSEYCGLHKNYGSSSSGSAVSEVCYCASYKKSDGLPCGKRVKPGHKYCMPHSANPILEPISKVDPTGCCGITTKKEQCKKTARKGFKTCAMHANQE